LIFDRYFYDLLVDPKRFRYRGPSWLIRCIGRAIPKPDLVILLNTSPGVLQARKQELSYEESERQQEAFLRLVRNLPNGRIIDADQTVEKVLSHANQILLDYLEDRLEERLGKR
jgi:thymidylate kinase